MGEPAPAPVATLPTTAASVGDDLLKLVRDDPELFARLMGEVYGLYETWMTPTEELLRRETKHVEFKQTARWDVNLGRKNKLMEEIIAKTVAGFLNAQGGTLLIGVDDDGNPIGLDRDYACVTPPTADGFVNWLDTMLQNALGHGGAHRVRVRIEEIKGSEVCRLDVPVSSKPIWTKFKGRGAVLFERRNNSTREVPSEEVAPFLTDRFEKQ